MLEKIKSLFKKPEIKNIWKPKQELSKDAENVYPFDLNFQKFIINNFKGIKQVEIDLVKNDLVLLLGLNESGKSTILKGIESFSFLNDPTIEENKNFFHSIRKKSDVGGSIPAIITAEIKLNGEISMPSLDIATTDLSDNDKESIKAFLYELNQLKSIVISRVFPFKDGMPQKCFYRFESEHPFVKNKLSNVLATELVNICPFILYFEDFKDRIPENIYINPKRTDSFDVVWFDIIDGLFYNTDVNFSIDQFKRLHLPSKEQYDDAHTVLTRVNKTLNQTFTEKWKELSGVEEIEYTELKYFNHRSTPYFTLKIRDNDGTNYSVDERSRGALWYLSFLMKTEFRSKKLRNNHGKPVFLIDEPASNLHSTAQANMINDFRMLAENTSIVYTTHSQYLVSLQNIKNTFIIEKKDGVVNAERWGEYLNRQDAQVSYYQPIANLLNIVPNSMEVPWSKAVITEGPSDRNFLIALYRMLIPKDIDFVVYPGTSASNLDHLISLCIGWNSSFSILLDSDREGNNAKNKYSKLFKLDNEIVLLPSDKNKLEKLIPSNEMKRIRDLLFKENTDKNVSKKEFATVWGIISEDIKYDSDILSILSTDTKNELTTLIGQLNI